MVISATEMSNTSAPCQAALRRCPQHANLIKGKHHLQLHAKRMDPTPVITLGNNTLGTYNSVERGAQRPTLPFHLEQCTISRKTSHKARAHSGTAALTGEAPSGAAPCSYEHMDEALEFVFFALCCLGKIPGGAPFSQLHKGGKQRRGWTRHWSDVPRYVPKPQHV